MQEDVLHYIWLYKKFEFINLKTTNNLNVVITSIGQHNHNSGPDFFNAKLEIDNQLWAGNVEIHVKSSDWYLHKHETDKAYDNVILHVVWEHDTEIFRKDNTEIPTLELKSIVNKDFYAQYLNLYTNKQQWINCENDFTSVTDFTFKNWIERLYFERLQRRAELISTLLEQSKNNWEAVLFQLLAKNFGLKVNGDVFLELSKSIDFSVVRKQQHNITQLEALFFGQANLLSDDVEDVYHKTLQKEYQFLKQKFCLKPMQSQLQFFRLRPANFPTIRLSQLANLFGTQHQLFSKLMKAKTLKEMYLVLDISVSKFWETHYTFSKTSKFQKKSLSKTFKDLLIINTIIPLKYSYTKYQGSFNAELLLEVIQEIPIENNSIVAKFQTIKKMSKTALQSQSLLELKTNYCDKNKCVQCAIGNALLQQK
ncbi:DUF2851 family protein [Aurantibacter sp.]|uniref:DUF2851 family protein n=1 Tax=Aurantibacter sp. TaxID=2807103 RepID=UPI0035C81ED8